MRIGLRPIWLSFLAAVVCFFSMVARADVWVTGYYPGYEQSSLVPANLDFSTLTHVIHFSLTPRADGSLALTNNNLTIVRVTNAVAVTHTAGKKILISVAGGSTFYGATTNANLGKFVTNLVTFMATNHYDGIDIDWEPLDSTIIKPYTNFIITLRAAMNTITPRPLLAAAVAGEEAMIASIQSQFDQINVMTYDIGGAYDGWVTWFNSPLLNGGYRFPSTGGLIPCGDTMISNYIAKGVAPGKLGLGIAFYGEIWKGGSGGTSGGGVSAPRQTWTNAPTLTGISYDDVMTSYFQTNLYHWESNAQSAYLSITNANATNNRFISYENEPACQGKVSYARNHGLGGIMIWELGQGYRPSQPAGQRDPLMKAIHQGLTTPQVTGASVVSNKLRLSFSTMPLGNYHIQWTTNLFSGVWNTLLTNYSSTGGVMQVTDPAVMNGMRFYRVRTP